MRAHSHSRRSSTSFCKEIDSARNARLRGSIVRRAGLRRPRTHRTGGCSHRSSRTPHFVRSATCTPPLSLSTRRGHDDSFVDTPCGRRCYYVRGNASSLWSWSSSWSSWSSSPSWSRSFASVLSSQHNTGREHALDTRRGENTRWKGDMRRDASRRPRYHHTQPCHDYPNHRRSVQE